MAVSVFVGVFVGMLVGVFVEVLVGVFVEVFVGVLVGVLVGVAQTTGVTLSVSSVTAPFRARALPARLALVFMVMLESARIFPTKAVVVSRVAELVTCQNTLQPGPGPLLIKTTDEPGAVVSALPILKTQAALGLP